MVYSATEFGKVKEDVANAGSNKRKDNFTQKYGLVCCNEIYNDKSGMGNLPATKNDNKTAKRTTHMMAIPKENMYELVDASHATMVETEQKLTDAISAGGV